MEDLSNFQFLKLLDLEQNRIQRISGIEFNLQIRILRLGKNQIKTIQNLNSLSKLNILDLKNNKITKISGIENCIGL